MLGVRLYGLASQVPAVALERVAAYQVMASSHVGPEHAGTCYREAGWVRRLRDVAEAAGDGLGGFVVRRTGTGYPCGAGALHG